MTPQDEARLDAALNDLAAADSGPPAGLRPAVMHKVLRDTPPIGGYRTARHGYGGPMTKKAMFGLAAAATVLLAIGLVTGFPPSIEGIQGTIGQAKRYVAPQIAEGDAAVGDPAVQQFIQSETFAALIADRDAVKLLSDPDLARALANQDLVAQLRRPDFVEALRQLQADGSLRMLIDDTELRSFVQNDLRMLMDDPNLRQLVVQPGAACDVWHSPRCGPSSARIRRTSPGRSGTRSSPPTCAAIPACAHALSNDALLKALSHSEFVAALRVPVFAQALRSPSFLRALTDPGFAQALRSPSMLRALSDPGFARAVNSAEFARAINAAELRSR